MKKNLFLFLLMLIPSLAMGSVSTSDTNLPVLGNAKSLYGMKTTYLGAQLIGVNSSNKVSIDSGAAGVVFGGETTLTGAAAFSSKATLATFLTLSNSTTCSPNAKTDASITPVGSYQIIAGFGSVTTVNAIASSNIGNGTILILRTNDSAKDIVFLETGNIALGAATRTLSNVTDKLTLIWQTASNKWVELFFSDID
jgi:hypothetical protein